MNHWTTMGALAEARQADLLDEARQARLAREARLHTSHQQHDAVDHGHRRLAAAVVSLVLALAMSASVALA